ncbi:MAG: type II secretion system protein N [Giesbergeria sp.]|uniref:type II secretion system protein N n=1 Tax=Giesbergeria sp. TaxID=2818473 RepID=UPI0026061A47|nr:type II secretion system protein N [Giesbergeria sp.]MDD2608754.1 type II secretion system protein N [Giesbergeria sp.]
MVISTHKPWGLRLGTLALWAATAASVGYWGLRLSAPVGGSVPAVATLAPALPDSAAIGRLLGGGALASATTAAPAPVGGTATAQLALLGVLAGQHSGAGAALIAVDKQPAKPFRVGAQVTEQLVLQSLAPRQARLGATPDGPSSLTLELPARR